MVAGRPTLYNAIYCEQVIEHLKDGKSLASFAASIGTHREVLWQWRQKHDEFNNACLIATEISQAHYEEKAYKIAIGEVPSDQKNNPGLLMFIMKQRFKDYREKTEVKQTIELPDNVEDYTDKELHTQLKEALKVLDKDEKRKSGTNSRGSKEKRKKARTHKGSKRKLT